ncbi:hypothetical protein Q7C36_015749 [Tachysurus vachellii]|uniref:Uncharacterized protein n=1 Tax=Tachysurus vachellii TaxID=175792 RepID=A0AA88M7D6_TACVA|nr:hypothetical protein Q7C36_015749 [Tachysurus vachellii]
MQRWSTTAGLTKPNIALGLKWTSSSSQPDSGCSHPTTPERWSFGRKQKEDDC